VFERPSQSGANLFSVAADGSGLVAVTKLKGLESEASSSPDGTKIAFTRARRPNAPFEIWVVNADGSGLRRLTRHRAFSTAPAWSPDGRRIVYATDKDAPAPKSKKARPGPWRLYVMDADGTDKKRLTRNRGRTSFGDPQWSPDGSRIAAARFRPANSPRRFDSSLLVMNADGTNRRRLTKPGGADELNPNWSPDGAKIAFEVTRLFDRRQSDLAVMGANGGGVRRLTRTKFFETNPVWAPDGTRIAFTSDRDRRALSRTRLGRGFELYTMETDGSGVVRVTTNRVAEVFPDWQTLP
jgi:Tol biopolymer transport system component